MDVSRLPTPHTFTEVMEAIDELTTEKHDYKTLVIDSLDWIEPLLWRQICSEHGKNSIEDVGGGYGKGYTYATAEWRNMILRLEKLRDTKQMNIVALAHCEIKQFQNPITSSGYDRYQLKLQKGASALWREAVEAVLFANFEVFTKSDKGQTRAFGEGARVIHSEFRPAYDAKNRYGLPLKMALSWPEFYQAVQNGQPESPDALLQSINSLLEGVTDPELKKVVEEFRDKAGKDAAGLTVVLNRLRARIEA